MRKKVLFYFLCFLSSVFGTIVVVVDSIASTYVEDIWVYGNLSFVLGTLLSFIIALIFMIPVKGKPLGKAVKQIEDILQDVPAFLQGAGVSTPFNPRRDVVPVVVGCSHKGCSRQKKEVKNEIPVYTRGLTETLDPRVRELFRIEEAGG